MKYIIVGLFSFLVLSCSKKEEIAPVEYKIDESGMQITLTDLQVKNSGIASLQLEEKNIAQKILLSGNIEVPPQAMASVSSPTGGYVRVSRFMPGNYVAKGQTLAVLEDPQIVQLQQDYLLAKSNLGYAQKDYNRQKELNQSKASSDKTTQLAQTEAQNQNIMVASLAAKLRTVGINPDKISVNNIQRTIPVVSPISGYISAVNVNIGQYVSPTEKLFEIINTTDNYLVLKVFEKDLNKISVGQMVYAFTNQNHTKKYPAKITLIGKDFAEDRSVMVYSKFADNREKLIPGTFMNAEIETNAETGLAIPDDAVVTWENQQFVFVEVAPHSYKMTSVEIGNSENGYTEIRDFENRLATKKIVISGAYHLLMALKNLEE
ncbi:MAG: efflux RND transporter periplasmic adaptor subunit [Cruoricaptor ignavus]|nr:efflux RND transporter periplasmic adaptor subunit [Cruoricaptor ignavus]